MDASTFERSISDFSKSLSGLNGWLVWMTAVVVLGLFIEYVPELKDEWEKFQKAGAWKSLTTRHSEARKPLAILLGAVLVIGGVAGEMVFEALSFHKEGQLEQAHSDLDEYLRKKSESAETSASGAVTDFNEANKQLGALTSTIGTLNGQLDLETNQVNAAKSQLSAAEATEKEEQQALINMSTCLTPRVIPQWKVINGWTERSLVDPLKPLAGTNVVIEYVPDFETRRAAFSILNVLQSAGWKVTSISAGTTLLDGVYIEPHRLSSPTDSGGVPDGSKAEDAADSLVAFLRSFNWQADKVSPSPPPSIPFGSLKVLVGLYPPVVSIRAPGMQSLMDDWIKLGKQIEGNFEEQERLHPEQRESLEREKNKELEPWRSPCHLLTYDFTSTIR